MEGWIKIHRKLSEWEWYTDPKMKSLFLHLILFANHKDGYYRGIEVKKGQLITGRKKLSLETGLSEQEVRTCLDKLEKSGEVTNKSTNKYTLIDISKYVSYQISEDEQPTTQPTNNQQITTNKNDKNKKKKENKETYKEKFSHFFENENFVEVWNEFVELKKRKKASTTDRALNSNLNKLEKLSGGSIEKSVEIVSRSCNSGWLDFYQIKNFDSNERKMVY